MDPDLDQLRFLLANLRETEASTAVEKRLLAEFQRLWPIWKADDRAEAGEERVGNVACDTQVK